MISTHFNKHINYVNDDLNGTKLKLLIFTRKTYFRELTNILYLCRLQRNYEGMQSTYKNELLALQHTRFDKKKNFIFLYI